MSTKVFLRPTGQHSRAMVRIANALRKRMPNNHVETRTLGTADIAVLYVIGKDAIPYIHEKAKKGIKLIVVQCCLDTAGGTMEEWQSVWALCHKVVSYLPFVTSLKNGVYMPLGVDDNFFNLELLSWEQKQNLVVTSGYVNGTGAEAIELVWDAAREADYSIVHVGPKNVHGVVNADKVTFAHNISDIELAQIYQKAKFVSGLRYIEGFELPAAEGMALGAMPIIFPHLLIENGGWYEEDLSVILSGEEYESDKNMLIEALTWQPDNKDDIEPTDNFRTYARDIFCWDCFCEGVFS